MLTDRLGVGKLRARSGVLQHQHHALEEGVVLNGHFLPVDVVEVPRSHSHEMKDESLGGRQAVGTSRGSVRRGANDSSGGVHHLKKRGHEKRRGKTWAIKLRYKYSPNNLIEDSKESQRHERSDVSPVEGR